MDLVKCDALSEAAMLWIPNFHFEKPMQNWNQSEEMFRKTSTLYL